MSGVELAVLAAGLGFIAGFLLGSVIERTQKRRILRRGFDERGWR